MKSFFKDLGIQVGAAVLGAASIVGIAMLASRFMPAPFF